MVKNIAAPTKKSTPKHTSSIGAAIALSLSLSLPSFALPGFMNRPPAPERPAIQPQAQPETLQQLDAIGHTIRAQQPSRIAYNRHTPESIAQTHLNHGLYFQAESAFRNMPQTSENRLNVARAQVGQNKFRQALNTLKPLLAQNQSDVRAFHSQLLLHMAETAYLNKNTSEAERQLNIFEATYSEGDTTAIRTRYHRLAETLGRIQRTPTKKQSFWGSDATTTPETATNKTFFRVGVLLPLSGNTAPVGQDILRGLQLSLFEQQAKNNSNVVTILYPQDTSGTPQDAAAAASRALKLGVDMIIGPLAANNVEAAASVLGRQNVPMLAFSSTAAVAAPNVHLLGYVPQQQARNAARAAAKEAINTNNNSLAALVPSTEFGYEVLGAYTDELNALGLSLDKTDFYNPQNADVGSALKNLLNLEQATIALQSEKKRLTKIKEELGTLMDEKDNRRLAYLQKAKPRADITFSSLFLPATATGLNLITAQMATFDADKLDYLLLGTASWNAATLSQNPPEYVKNGRFFAPETPNTFINTFQTAYKSPPHPLAVLGYDAATIAQSVATEVTNAGFSPSEALLRPEGFAGLGGALKFNSNGLTTRAYNTFKVNSLGTSISAQAPKLLPPVNLDVVPAAQPSRIKIPTFNNNRFIPF